MQIKVGTVTYKVNFKLVNEISGNKKDIDIEKTEEGFYLGRTNFATLNIEVAEEMPQEKKVNTLWHEIVHTILYNYGIKQKDEEGFCNLMATIIIQLIKDNPQLIRYTEDA